MAAWRSLLAPDAGYKASRYGVLEDDADKLTQPLIGAHDDAGGGYSGRRLYDRYNEEDSDLERGVGEDERLLHHKRRAYENVPLGAQPKSSPVDVLRSIVTHVLWPMTPVGPQTAKVYEHPPRSTVASTPAQRSALHTVTTLQALTSKPLRRNSETLEEVHEKALVRIAAVTLCFTTWLIITVYRHA